MFEVFCAFAIYLDGVLYVHCHRKFSALRQKIKKYIKCVDIVYDLCFEAAIDFVIELPT